MLEKISDHIAKLVKTEPAIARQFIASPDECTSEPQALSDPLLEDDHQPVRGLIHKYANRVLCLVTAECAAYCRFCTRRRMVSDIERGRMTRDDVDAWYTYIESHDEVREVIFSGGDPFAAPVDLLRYAVERLSGISGIRIIRVGTRVPVSDPSLLNEDRLEIIRSVRQPVYVGINFEHPAEITPETADAIIKLRKAGAILYSQTVFLAGVNDNYDTLYRLFYLLFEIGVRPYYIYRCDPVLGAEHFRCNFEMEHKIMTKLRKNLSGLACPTYVIDTPNGCGKVPVALDFWQTDFSSFRDFTGEIQDTDGIVRKAGETSS